MPKHPLVLVHGYSDKGRSFGPWRQALEQHGYDLKSVYIGNYVSLSNEVTIKDIAEGLDRALREEGIGSDRPFDAIVHSTGMLVIRSWLASYTASDRRARRLKRLIALAPATYGSPLAHKGRSFLGALFKGERDIRKPDFMEAGDEVLYALELGSRFTWDLAHHDLVAEEPTFTMKPDSPYAFVFCGDRPYGGLRKIVSPPGSDGTVRWAGCALDTRKFIVDLSTESTARSATARATVAPFGDQDIPLIPIAGLDHGTILSSPTEELVRLVLSALRVDSADDYTAWLQRALETTAATRNAMDEWQQFVIRVVDERGDPVPDWNLQLLGLDGAGREIVSFNLDVHVYARDKSLRCFHLNHTQLEQDRERRWSRLGLRLIASSGSELVGYHGYGSERIDASGTRMSRRGILDASIDLPAVLGEERIRFFYPLTTTLVELRLNREPLPLVGRNKVFWF